MSSSGGEELHQTSWLPQWAFVSLLQHNAVIMANKNVGDHTLTLLSLFICCCPVRSNDMIYRGAVAWDRGC